MEREQFDQLTRALANSPTRRTIARAIAGLAVGAAVFSASEESDAKKKKKCGPCRIRKKGRCRGNKPDGTTCNGDGQCFAGNCNPKPACQGTGTDCTQGNPGVCCSGACRAGDNKCQNGGNGSPCLQTSDCITPSTCVAYICRAE